MVINAHAFSVRQEAFAQQWDSNRLVLYVSILFKKETVTFNNIANFGRLINLIGVFGTLSLFFFFLVPAGKSSV